jgi:hypothetical protein
MKRFLKYLGLVIAVVGGFFYIVVNHSISEEIHFVCKGDYSQKESEHGGDLYFTWRKYKWFVDLWSESDGEIYLETGDGYLDFHSNVETVDSFRQLRMRDRYSTPPLVLTGQYNFPSKKLWLKSTPSGTFNGICEETGER